MKLNYYLLTMLLFWGGQVFSQYTISGSVVNENGEPILNASVIILETFRGDYTNEEGRFEIKNLPKGEYQIQVSFLGYEKYTEKIKLEKDEKLELSIRPASLLTSEVTVSATRANDLTPMTKTDVSKEELEKNNTGQDIPYLLRFTPSIVTTADAGAGIGYTGLRIRGSDATRINVTINGIPLNDPESQGVWWVNMPDFASSVDDIQIQRGVGTSTNGAGAFGASLNMQTTTAKTKPYGEVALSGGSFNSLRTSASFGTGLLKDHWTIDGRLSRITSDGYIDRASSDLRSYYFSGGYLGANTNIRFVTFSGEEKTYQAWNGVPERYLTNNRTFNPYDYDNEVDHYNQSHYQLLTNTKLSENWTLSLNGHYTLGEGYFEQYKGDQFNSLLNYGSKENLSDYGIDPIVLGNDTISQSNLIRRRWLDNDFYGAVFSFNYNPSNNKVKFTLGGAWNQYIGEHFGEVIWAENAGNSNIRERYYDNEATKNDFNVYAKANYQLSEKLNIYGDLQYRNVYYEFQGIDQFGNPLPDRDMMDFFNPKAGLTYYLNEKNRFYGSFAVAHREPNRDDYTENSINNRPRSEQLIDYEAGYHYLGNKFQLSSNLYYMHYNDQLVVTGELNDVGAPKKVNVPESFRAGLEVAAGWRINELFDWNVNLTLSQNKIKEFTEFTDDWTNGGQITTVHQNTDIAFSPNAIAGQELVYHALKQVGRKNKSSLDVALLGKYVGAQFIDNTRNPNRKLNEYSVFDLRFEYKLEPTFMKELVFNFTVHNLLDTEYVSNAWSYAFRSEGYDPTPDDPYVNAEGNDNYNMIGYFPNATRYFMGGVKLRF